MSLSLTWSIKRVHTKFEFKIARSAENYYDRVILELSDGQHLAYGEAAPNIRYEVGPEAVLGMLEAKQN